jgi:hypothetical protein
MRISIPAFLLASVFISTASLSVPMHAQDNNPPNVFDLSTARIQIVDTRFVTALESPENKKQFKETEPDKYRGLVVTVKIAKEPGANVVLIAQDISLHYRFGGNSDVAKCFGLSNFTVSQYDARQMSLYKEGWGNVITGSDARASSTVYVDLFFQNMEPDTHELYLFMAQPASAQFITPGWKKE